MVEKRENHSVKTAPEEKKDRRNFLKQGLIAASSLSFGYSLISEAWADQPRASKEMKVRSKARVKPRSPGHLTLAPVKRKEAVRRITPTLNDLLLKAGVKLDAKEMESLQNAFAERGTIKISGGNSRVASSLTIGGSITWN